MKRILSYILVASMLLTTLPAVVFATNDAIIDMSSWKKTSNNYVTVSQTADGFQMLQITTKLYADKSNPEDPTVVRNTASAGKIVGGLGIVIETNEDDRTTLSTTQLRGKFDVNIKYKANVDRMDKYTSVDSGGKEKEVDFGGYYNLILGPGNYSNLTGVTANALIMRIDKTKISVLNSSSAVNSSMSISELNNIDNLNGAEHSIKISFDTDANTQTVTVDNSSTLTSTGSIGSSAEYINAVTLTGLQRMNTGAYFTFKEVSVTQNEYSEDVKSIIDQLPETLVSDVNAVTGNIEIPEINGVTWTSSDASVMGTDGSVIRGTEDTNVTLTAKFYGYEKTYEMTVSKTEEETEAPEIPDAPQVSDISSVDISKWHTVSSNYMNITNDENGLNMLQTDSKLYLDNSTTARNTAQTGSVYGGLSTVLEDDTENKSTLRTTQLRGVFDIIVKYKANVDRYQKHNGNAIEGFYYFNVGSMTNPDKPTALSKTSLYMRVDQSIYTALNAGSFGANSMSREGDKFNISPVNNLSGAEHTVKMSFDTVNLKQSVMIDDNPELVSSGDITVPNFEYINGIQINGLERMNVGAYFNIKEVSVKQYSYPADIQAYINQLPSKLVDDINAVTEDIVLPNITGAVWTSSNESVIGTDGKVTRYSTDFDVTLTVSYKGYEKSYTMTVAKDENATEEPDKPAEETNKLIFHESDYASMGSLKGWNYSIPGGTGEVKVEDGSIIATVTGGLSNNADGSLNSNNALFITKNFEGVLETDEVNGTSTVANGFTGKYAIEFTFKSNMTTHRHQANNITSLNNTYYFITFGYKDPSNAGVNLTDTFADLRIPGYSRSMNATPDYSTPHFYHAVDSTGVKLAYHFGNIDYEEDTTLRMVFDTVNKTIDGYLMNDKGEFVKSFEEIPFIFGTGSSGVINAMRIQCQEAFDDGSYIEIKDLKMYEVLPATSDERYEKGMAFVDQMPEKMVDDYTNVTATGLELPAEVDGKNIGWTSGNTMVLGTDGTINRWVDDSYTYIMGGASFTDSMNAALMPIGFYKKYDLNIPSIEGAESKVVYSGDYSENSWIIGSFHEQLTATHTLTDNKIVLEKLTASDPSAYKEEKSYYAIQKIKGEEQAYDEATRSKLLSDAYSGIYDLEFDLDAVITSADYPATIELGYYNSLDKIFKTMGTVEVRNSNIVLKTFQSAEKSVDTELGIMTSGLTKSFKLRVDTNLNKMWAYIDDAMVTDTLGVSYYNPLGSQNIVNAFRVALDKNLESGDKVEISNVSFTQKLKSEVAAKNALLNVVDNLTVDDITNTPTAVSSNIKDLPDKVGGYDVIWTSSDANMINPETGVVFGVSSDTDVWLTAELLNTDVEYPVSVYKEFKLTVPAASDEGMLQYQLNKLKLSDYTKQSLDSLVYDLDLPSTDSFGTSIIWTSSNLEILDNNGKITDDILPSYETVTLTATLSNGSATASKEFTVTVAPHGKNHVLYTGSGPKFNVNGVENVSVYGNVWLTLNKGTANGMVSVTDAEGTVLFTVDVNDSTPQISKIIIVPEQNIYTVFDGEGNVVEEGMHLNSSAGAISSVIYEDSVLGGIVVEGDTNTLLKTAMEYVSYVVPAAVTENQVFPRDVVFGVPVQWSTNNQNVLSNDGTLTVPDVYTFVDITCTLTADSIVYEKTKTVAVPCSPDGNILLDADITASSASQSGHPIKNAVDGDAETYGEISVTAAGTYFTAELDEERYINTIYFAEPVENINEYIIEYSTDGKTWNTAATGIAISKNTLVSFNTVNAKHIRLTVSNAQNTKVALSAFEAYLHTDENTLMRLELESIVIDSEYTLSGNIDLPETGVYGTEIKWTSSDEDILSADGTYNQPTTSKVITLTATMPSGDSKEFKFYAKGKKGGEGPTSSGGGGGAGGGGSAGLGSAIIANPEVNLPATSTIIPSEVKKDVVFDDVTTNKWYYPYVMDLKKQGIVSGDGSGYFYPDNRVTREEFVKMLILGLDIEVIESNEVFTDVNPDAWYFDTVMTAYNTGVVKGMGETLFGIGSDITRQDMAVMVWRVLTNNGYTFETPYATFADDSAIADYAKEAVYAMKSAGILDGYNNNFAPTDALTRAESAKVISSLCALIAQ